MREGWPKCLGRKDGELSLHQQMFKIADILLRFETGACQMRPLSKIEAPLPRRVKLIEEWAKCLSEFYQFSLLNAGDLRGGKKV